MDARSAREDSPHGIQCVLNDPPPLSLLLTYLFVAPFSYGPYSCIGKQLALQEMRLVLTAIIRAFDAKLPDDFDARSYMKSNKAFFTMQILNKLPVIFSRRQIKPQS